MPTEESGCEQMNLIPVKKVYYSISEVCRITSLEPHVLRYWESEFPQLRPKKNRSGNRAYREKDIEQIIQIKRLLYEEKFTIPGAKKQLQENRSADISEKNKSEIQDDVQPAEPNNQIGSRNTSSLRCELEEILALLKS